MSTNYLAIYEAVMKQGGTDPEAAEAVAKAFDADEQVKADEEADAMEST